MKTESVNYSLGIVLLCTFVTSTASAQKQTAAKVLPKPEQAFSDAKIGRTYKDSIPGTMALTKAPVGAPNVLIILIDDSGFGQWGTFGGQIPTPSLDRLAKMGLRYTRFHTTALCSPTRAALLTGRNHHSAGTGVITEIGVAYPGYSGQIPKSAAMFAEVLRQNGYSTAFIGKNHNIADWETSISGPFDRWPSLQGFDYFYGFIGGGWTNGNRFFIATLRL
jgi:arylsulfatase A-like enzyme